MSSSETIARSSRACWICGRPLSLRRVSNIPVCDDSRCRASYQVQLQQCRKICAICHRPLSVHQEVRGEVCDNKPCQLEYLSRELSSHSSEEKERNLREVMEYEEHCLAELKESAQALRDEQAAAAGVGDPESYPVVIVPSNTREITELPERRRQAFRDHLQHLVNNAVERHDASPTVVSDDKTENIEPAAEDGARHACAVCKGDCCSNGGDHAFLSIHLMRNFMERQPTLCAQGVIEAYLSRLSEQTYAGSCVYHARDGCALPRDMRSNTCNEYACTGLNQYQKLFFGSRPNRAFVATCDETQINETDFVRNFA